MSTKVPWADKIKIWELKYLNETPIDKIRYQLTPDGNAPNTPSLGWATVRQVVDEFPSLTPAQVMALPELLELRWREVATLPDAGQPAKYPSKDYIDKKLAEAEERMRAKILAIGEETELGHSYTLPEGSPVRSVLEI